MFDRIFLVGGGEGGSIFLCLLSINRNFDTSKYNLHSLGLRTYGISIVVLISLHVYMYIA